MEIVRGNQDELVPAQSIVLRASKLPPDYRPGRPILKEAFNFELSTDDKKSANPKLSVYVEGLTTEEQVRSLVGDESSYRLIARLVVQEVRAIEVSGHRLDVVWDDALLPDGTPDTRPGADGHAGITGLNRPPAVEKALFKTLRAKLANAVGENYTVL